jgi:DNA-binding winged helix-turn-helix (wHTH) protein/predicted ATPase
MRSLFGNCSVAVKRRPQNNNTYLQATSSISLTRCKERLHEQLHSLSATRPPPRHRNIQDGRRRDFRAWQIRRSVPLDRDVTDGRSTWRPNDVSSAGERQQLGSLFFPPFRLDPADARLWRGKRSVSLKPKSFAVLHHLLINAGRLVTKDELLDAAWSGVHVGDAVIKTTIKEIRLALSDAAKTPRFIATVHRRGYRFIARVQSGGASVPADSPSARRRHPLPLGSPGTSSLQPLLGRESELARLQGVLAEALEGGRRLVLVTGIPGIGKSALLEAFMASLAGRQDLWLARGECLPQAGPAESYLPVLEAFGLLCREAGAAPVKSALARHAPLWLAQLPTLLTEPELEALQQRIGASGGPERMLRQMAEAVEVLTAERLLVLCIDDLQWSDRATLELIDMLARRQPKARLLLVGAYRSDEVVDARHPLLILKQDLQIRGRCAELALGPLPAAAVAQYCAQRLGTDEPSSLRALPTLVHERSGGHPLFMTAIVDEIVRREVVVQQPGHRALKAVLDDAAGSVRGFVAGEFDRLDPDRQRLLEAASVAGREFSVAALAAALMTDAEEVEAAATELARRQQFLCALPAAPSSGSDASARFAFRHDIYREVLHDRLTPGRRSILNRRLGDWLESTRGEMAGEIAGSLAIHFEECGKWLRAARYYRLASEQAQRRHAPREAAAHARRGVACSHRAPLGQEQIREELLLQQALSVAVITSDGFAASELSQVYSRATELCSEAEDIENAVPVLCGLWNLALNQGHGRRASELADQLLSLAEKSSATVPLLQAHLVAAQTRFFHGQPAAAESHLVRSLTLYDRVSHRHLVDVYGEDPGVVARLAAGWVAWLLGQPARARQQIDDALSSSHSLGHPFVLGQALWCSAIVHQHAGEVDATRGDAEALIQLCRKGRINLWLGGARALRGWAVARQGRGGKGLAQLRRGINHWRSTGTLWMVPYYLGLYADALIQQHAVEEATGILTEAFAIGDATGEQWYDAELHRLAGEAAWRGGDRGGAADHFQRSLETARRQGAQAWELRAKECLEQARQLPADEASTI